MQIIVHLDRQHYRVSTANMCILAIGQRRAEVNGQRAPLVYWRSLWKPGRPLPESLLPVIAEARRQLGTLRLADAKDLETIAWLASRGRLSVPAWIWPERPPKQPKRPQVQDWRRHREPGGWPPPAA